MKPKPPTDAFIRWAIATSTNGTFDHQAFTDLLRCRRALRRIRKVATDPLAVLRIADEAIGKGGLG